METRDSSILHTSVQLGKHEHVNIAYLFSTISFYINRTRNQHPLVDFEVAHMLQTIFVEPWVER